MYGEMGQKIKGSRLICMKKKDTQCVVVCGYGIICKSTISNNNKNYITNIVLGYLLFCCFLSSVIANCSFHFLALNEAQTYMFFLLNFIIWFYYKNDVIIIITTTTRRRQKN